MEGVSEEFPLGELRALLKEVSAQYDHSQKLREVMRAMAGDKTDHWIGFMQQHGVPLIMAESWLALHPQGTAEGFAKFAEYMLSKLKEAHVAEIMAETRQSVNEALAAFEPPAVDTPALTPPPEEPAEPTPAPESAPEADLPPTTPAIEPEPASAAPAPAAKAEAVPVVAVPEAPADGLPGPTRPKTETLSETDLNALQIPNDTPGATPAIIERATATPETNDEERAAQLMNDATAAWNEAKGLNNAGKYTEALPILEPFIESLEDIKTASPDRYRQMCAQLGIAYQGLGRHEEALDFFESAQSIESRGDVAGLMEVSQKVLATKATPPPPPPADDDVESSQVSGSHGRVEYLLTSTIEELHNKLQKKPKEQQQKMVENWAERLANETAPDVDVMENILELGKEMRLKLDNLTSWITHAETKVPYDAKNLKRIKKKLEKAAQQNRDGDPAGSERTLAPYVHRLQEIQEADGTIAYNICLLIGSAYMILNTWDGYADASTWFKKARAINATEEVKNLIKKCSIWRRPIR